MDHYYEYHPTFQHLETWVPLPDYSRYEISTSGRVRNVDRGIVMSTRPNRSAFVMVNLTDDEGEIRTRSVATLMAETFIPRSSPHCDTVIMKDGKRDNLTIENLEWRPRWFAIKYHQQVRAPHREVRSPIRVVETMEIFRNVRELSVKYGLLEDEILAALVSGDSIWPYDFHVFLDH